LTLNKTQVALTGAVDAAVEAARPLLDRKQQRLTVTLPPVEATIDGDPVRITQIVSNLLTNAAKYTDQGGDVDLTATVARGDVMIEVRDTGIGIPAESLGSIFTMFSQVAGTSGRSDGGLGIGLALVKGLVDLHGGSIRADSDGPGRGSTFTVRLPLADAGAVRAAERSDAARRPGSARRVLVVDDNRDAADSLGLLLQLAGHDVRVAHDGVAALAIARTFLPELALLDLGMPEMDGLQLAQALRAEPWSATLRLAALTGWGQDEDRRRTSAAGFDHHLTKPVDLDEIAALVAQLSVRTP
jgi:CheY-like chemotaxis protein